MNSTTLLAFLYAISAEEVQSAAFRQLATLLKCQTIDWDGVQEKWNEILSLHPNLQELCIHYKTQLASQNPVALLPNQENLNQFYQPVRRSGLPGKPDKETTEITNTAVLILQSDNPPALAKKLLQPLPEKPK
jgi:hypothetical protein